MKDYALELASQQSGHNAKLNILREYTQAYILRIMYGEGVFRTTAFVGGTALRFLYGLPRFSEDLDFSLVKESKILFEPLIRKIESELRLAGYAISLASKDEKTVQSAFIKFDSLLYEAGISPLKSQKLSVKLEIDTNPPQGAVLETQIVNKYFPISFLSYKLNSLFAGKLHALLSRKYTKGRDFFDLGWYLSKWKGISPNIIFLANALKQTGYKGALPKENNWKDTIQEVVLSADWKKVKQDVVNFLENPTDADILNQENIFRLLKE